MGEQDRTPKFLLGVIVVIVAILAIVAIIIAAISLGASNRPDIAYQLPSNGGGSSSGSSGGSNNGGSSNGASTNGGSDSTVNVNVQSGGSSAQSDKTWMIGVGHDWGAMEYIDEAGYLRGFQFDLIAEVCAAANIQCRTVWEPYKNCIDSEPGQHSFGGKGLMGGWYDSCTGWLQTVGRSQIYDFSMPWFKDEPAYFWAKSGGGFDWKNLEDKTLGFLDGWWTDEKCLARMPDIKGTPLPVPNVKHYQTTDQLIAAVKSGEIDAAYGADLVVKEESGVERSGDGYLCSVAGSSMMTRKDNTFAAHWNRGFQTIVSNGKFKKLCDEGKDKHESDGRKLSPCV